MGKRVESPSSLNTFLQCKRKYYYQYIEKLPTKLSIHTVRGNIAHSTLEAFYVLDVSSFPQAHYETQFTLALQKLFLEQWGMYKEDLYSLQLSSKDLEFYFEETLFMLLHWCGFFLEDFRRNYTGNIKETFEKLKPITEVEYHSEQLSVHGFLDAISSVDNEVHIIDYKTSARSEVKESMRLQLGIYSLLYTEKHGKPPEKVGIFFLRDRLYLFPVDEELLENAREALLSLHAHTSKTDNVKDYQKTISPLCKWKNGQCDFYAVCKPFD